MRRALLALVFLVWVPACGGDDGGSADIDAEVPDDHPDGQVPAGCDPSGEAPECNNCVDDDHDGRIDGEDIECTGAADDDESSFETAIPGDNMDDTWQDCFFDGNSGAGDDDCRFNTCCFYDPDCPDDPNSCTATDACVAACAPLTPPNCDCFGCCNMCDDEGCVDIVVNPAVAPDCDEDVIHDEALCPRCEPSTECGTQCEGTGECDADTPCPDNQFCSGGCCVAVVE